MVDREKNGRKGPEAMRSRRLGLLLRYGDK